MGKADDDPLAAHLCPLGEVMGDLRKCPNCGNLQAHGDFCAKCGTDISQVKPFIEDYAPVRASHAPSDDYGVLRFVSGVFVFLGWVTIVLSVVTACLYYYGMVAPANAIISQSGELARTMSELGVIVASLLTLFIMLIGVVGGVAEIAIGELILVFLDIRNDVRKISSK